MTKKILSVVCKTILFVVGFVAIFVEEIWGALIFAFETVLFIVLLLTCPVWLLPYMLIVKHKEKKNESRDNK